MNKIYLDNNATTALDDRVLQAMLVELKGPPANPSSIHSFGKAARAILTQARESVAHFFHAKPEEIIFTSGGTESLNFLLRSLPQGHVITSTIEHAAIDKTLRSLPLETTFIPVDAYGAPSPAQIEAAIRPDTKALIFTLSNNITGVKIDIEAIANIAQKHSIPLFLDAVSYIGKEPLPLHPAITAIAISAHKFHGPKGVGALFLRAHSKLPSLLTGGNQENLHRAGTENLAGILGLAEAIRILSQEQTQITNYIRSLRDHFENSLLTAFPELQVNGQGPRVCNTSNIAFPMLDGETLLIQLDRLGIATSHGSACSSGAIEPSRILLSMGLPRKTARCSLRFSFSKLNTKEEVDQVILQISHLIQSCK